MPTETEIRPVNDPFVAPLATDMSQCRAKIVRWVSESCQPFDIVEDHGFQYLMKAGRLEIYIPSATTVSQDVKLVFARTRERIAKMLQVGYFSSSGSKF